MRQRVSSSNLNGRALDTNFLMGLSEASALAYSASMVLERRQRSRC